jgi:hypothetical protein
MDLATSPNVKTFTPTSTLCSYISRSYNMHFQVSLTTDIYTHHHYHFHLFYIITFNIHDGYLQEISLEAMEERANQRERWPSKCFV